MREREREREREIEEEREKIILFDWVVYQKKNWDVRYIVKWIG